MRAKLFIVAVAVLQTAAWLQAAESPRIQLGSLNGEIEFSPADRSGLARWQPELPYLEAGSKVSMISGSAAIETDNHARIEAETGDQFTVAPFTRDGVNGLLVRANAGAVVVQLADLRVLLAPGAGLALYGEGRDAKLELITAPASIMGGSVLHEGETLSVSNEGSLVEGDIAGLHITPGAGFASEPLNPADLNITETGSGGSRRVTVRSGMPADLRMAPGPVRKTRPALQDVELSPASLPEQPTQWPGTDGWPLDRRLSTDRIPE